MGSPAKSREERSVRRRGPKAWAQRMAHDIGTAIKY
jgi:hypothetical protein